MLTRQKTLLYMLKRAQRPVSRMELMKWCFLLRMETPSQGGPSFYEFVPYHYGPFSFGIYREVAKLIELGELREYDSKSWEIAPDSCQDDYCLAPSIEQDIDHTICRFNSKAVSHLVDYVYSHYPFFTVNSRRNSKQDRPIADPGIYTVGYQGLQIDGFLNVLIQAGIRHVIDIRKNPIARRYGFHKSTLRRLCNRLSIDYTHLPQLGIPSEYRQNLQQDEDYRQLFQKYETEILPHQEKTLVELNSLVQDQPCALVCMEANPARCHRSILAKHVAAATDLPVFSLGN